MSSDNDGWITIQKKVRKTIPVVSPLELEIEKFNELVYFALTWDGDKTILLLDEYCINQSKYIPQAILKRCTLNKKKYPEPAILTSSLNDKALSLNKITFSYKAVSKVYQANNKTFFTIIELVSILINFQQVIYREDPELLEYVNEDLITEQHATLRSFVKIYIIDNKPDNLVLGSVWSERVNYK